MRYIPILAIAVVVGLAGALWSQEAPAPVPAPEPASAPQPAPATGLKVGVVDIAKVFDDYGQSQDLEERINKEKDALEAEGKARRDEIQRKKEELDQLNPTAQRYRELEAEINRLEADFRFFREKGGQQLEARYDDYTDQILTEIEAEIGRYGAENGFTLIFKVESKPVRGPRALQFHLKGVLYHTPEIDVTDPVLVRLNAAYEAEKQKK